MSAITIRHQNPVSYCIRGNLVFVSKTPALRNAHGTLGKLYNNPRVPETHQNCEGLRPGGLSPEIKVSTLCHLATCQAVVLRSEIKVTFELHNFSFASSLSHVWVTNPYPQHGDTTLDWLTK
jgi:hypothetical protein